ncbi:MAG TPA: hypoxanthine phosphoribosyltransferase [Kiritimatiellia bacterium]|nr:hypoxanthine phosphoribosyltransferase [Kiritimatiellia bacterium]
MKPHHIKDVVISAEAIAKRVDTLVSEMQAACRSDNFVMIGVLRGSFIFLADLARDLYEHGVRPRIDFLTLESYGSETESSGTVRVVKDIRMDVQEADVMLVDDILDSGRTLSFATKHLMDKGARSVQTVALLDKPARRVIPFQADFVGFTVPDEFVVGYGLDYDSFYRELPYIAKVTFTE